MKKNVCLLFIFIVIILPIDASAFSWKDFFGDEDINNNISTSTSSVTNNITSSASTGGNTVENGVVIEGEASVKTSIETIINGKTVQDIEIEEKSQDGNASIDIESQVNADSEKAEVNTLIKTDDKEEKQREVIYFEDNESTKSIKTKKSIQRSTSTKEEAKNASEQEKISQKKVSRIIINIFSSFREGFRKLLDFLF